MKRDLTSISRISKVLKSHASTVVMSGVVVMEV